MNKKLILTTIITLCFSLTACTSSSQPKIDIVESDLGIDIPNNYELTEYYEDWFGFDLKQEFTFQFNEKEFQELLKEIENNEQWGTNESGYEYKKQHKSGDGQTIHSQVEAFVDLKSQTLYYEFMDL